MGREEEGSWMTGRLTDIVSNSFLFAALYRVVHIVSRCVAGEAIS